MEQEITIENINEFTEEQILIFLKNKMKEQKSLAISDDGRCKYRMSDGRKCVIGHLIPDDLYFPEMEGRPAIMVIQRLRNACKIPPNSQKDAFLVWLQHQHDHSSRVSELVSKITERIYELNRKRKND